MLVVQSGTVVVACGLTLGRRVVVAVADSGGVLLVPSGDQRLVALEDAAVLAVTADVWRRLLGRPAAAEAIGGALFEALRERELSLAQFAYVAHVERVRGKLLQLARVHGRCVDGALQVELPLTHALLAEMVGSARETVTGAVRALEQEGFLVREGGRYRLLLAPEAVASPASEPV
jgi:CRP-like cAMP-binding protein